MADADVRRLDEWVIAERFGLNVVEMRRTWDLQTFCESLEYLRACAERDAILTERS